MSTPFIPVSCKRIQLYVPGSYYISYREKNRWSENVLEKEVRGRDEFKSVRFRKKSVKMCSCKSFYGFI